MRFLLDENVSPIVGSALRSLGHDIALATQVCGGALDEDVLLLAIAEDRILIREDKDFGELAFRDGVRPPTLIRLLLPKLTPEQKAARICSLLKEIEGARGSTLVIEVTRTRLRRW